MKDIMLFLHFIGLAMGIGAGFSNLFLGIAASKMPPEEAGPFIKKTMVLMRMGQIGIALLIISGIYLMTPYWYSLSAMPLLIAKLVLVVLLIILIGINTVAGGKFKNGDASQINTMKPVGRLTLLTALAIVVLAVMVFH